MDKIKILDKETVNKIAAGEVIERPYSVIKELLENSIDAGADTITIEVKDGGKSYIRVADNGCGMSREDALLSFLPHTTSKLNDLFNITTLGFRGEALSSISAVSSLKLSTKEESGKGIQVDVSAGKLIGSRPIGMNKGTVIEVSDIFFNTPARKKYLKSKEVELSHIIDLVTRYSLSSNTISIRLISDGKEIFSSPKTTILNKIVGIYGKEIAKNLIEINYNDDFTKIAGFISKPYLTKTDKSMQTLFVNNRLVKSDTISKSVYDAYKTLLFLDRHPVFILSIKIDFTEIDVNVHPTKNIIRIEKEEKLYQSVFNAIRKTFTENSLVPDVNAENETSITSKQNYKIEKDTQKLLVSKETSANYIGSDDLKSIDNKNDDSVGKNNEKNNDISSSQNNSQTSSIQNKIGPVIILGQLNKMYILAENPKGLLIIDQHAMQERVYFERFWREYKDKKILQQKLLRPLIIELGVREKTLLSDNLKELQSLGFDIEEYGKDSFIIRQVPKIFSVFTKQQIHDIITELKDIDRHLGTIKENKIARMACRAAVKAGEQLTRPQMELLISQLDECENPYSCPHGRPTMINLSLADLEKKFKRIA